jgi:hypothetical protein
VSIVRAPRKKSNFTILDNDVIHDSRLSYRASGVLIEILARPDNWRTNAEQLARQRNQEGRQAIRTALKELRAAGYLVHQKVRDPETGRISTVSYVYDEPQETVDEEFLNRKQKRRRPQPPSPASKKPTSGYPASGKLDPFTRTESKDCEEVLEKINGIEASSDDDHRPVNGSAPPLARRRTSPKTISDPLTKDTADDDAEAVKIASEYLDDDEAETLVDYLRRDRNASTTAGHMRYLEDSGGAGITSMATKAQDWAKYLDGKHSHITSALKNAGFKPQDATAIADVTRDALAIRCPERSVAEAINGTFRDGADAVRGALGSLIGARGAERRQERINRVRRQREAVA